MGPKPSQKQRKATRRSPQRIAALAKDINGGKLKLRDLGQPSHADYIAIKALVDSGSSVHVVNAKTFFPNSSIIPPPRDHTGFTVADGSRIPHCGFVQTHVTTHDGENKTIRWNVANAALPIISTHELARNGTNLDYDEHDGPIINKETKHITNFDQTAGVYVVHLLVKHDLLPSDANADVGRPKP